LLPVESRSAAGAPAESHQQNGTAGEGTGGTDNPAPMENELREAVLASSTRAEVREAVEAAYRQLQAAIDIRKPICTSSGRCCHFERFGHRIYVTTMELATFVADLSVVRGPVARDSSHANGSACAEAHPTGLPVLSTHNGSTAAAAGGSTALTAGGQMTTGKADCPFQLDRLCSVHTIRPFGCRVFFCDETATQWQHDQYERHHGQLRRLHEELAVPYFYVEWRRALRALGM
jgi:Fe-S-cluster containining protein